MFIIKVIRIDLIFFMTSFRARFIACLRVSLLFCSVTAVAAVADPDATAHCAFKHVSHIQSKGARITGFTNSHIELYTHLHACALNFTKI